MIVSKFPKTIKCHNFGISDNNSCERESGKLRSRMGNLSERERRF